MLVTVMMECLTLYYPWIQRHATVLAGLLTANPTLGFVHERRGMAVCAIRSACTDVQNSAKPVVPHVFRTFPII